MTALLYALGVLAFALVIVVSIGLHEIGHMVPAKRFGGKVTQYFIGFGPTVCEQAGRRDRVRRQGDPARRLRQDRRDAAARHRPRRRGREGRRRQRRDHRAALQHRGVQPAGVRRARRGWEHIRPEDSDRLFTGCRGGGRSS
ncbi:MAG: site-2 protease family protein [Nocardioides sp.]